MAGTRMTQAQRLSIYKAVAQAVTKQLQSDLKPKMEEHARKLFSDVYHHLYHSHELDMASNLLITEKLATTFVALDITKIISSDDMGTYGLKAFGTMMMQTGATTAKRWWSVTEVPGWGINLGQQYPETLITRVEYPSQESAALKAGMSKHKGAMLKELHVFEDAVTQLTEIRAAIFGALSAEDLKKALPSITEVIDAVVIPPTRMPAVIDPKLDKMLANLKPIEVN